MPISDRRPPAFSEPLAIEGDFPFEHLSTIAEVESWRKEVWRPVYHTHKWWAQRLGSVFRAAVLGCTTHDPSALMALYASRTTSSATVFDPFMGSGTTVGEAHKLGCTVIGRDINPVAWRVVRSALRPLDRRKLLKMFSDLERTVAPKLLGLHRSTDSLGNPCDVLYWFWVKQLDCPACHKSVDLFSSRVFARHAYVKKFPTVQASCPGCGAVTPFNNDETSTCCRSCGASFDPHTGPVAGAKATCDGCGHTFAMAKVAKATGMPPRHRLFAKLVLRADGDKEYLRATDADVHSYQSAQTLLAALNPPLPAGEISAGHNTSQVLNYGYSRWAQFFNDRQLLGISLLASQISSFPPSSERDALHMLLAGVLEFNNMFASYKGEGTGAVRHMFSHHVLRPERTPIEANLWGTAKSSGSFLNLFKLRLLRAVDYKADPFEITVDPTAPKAGVKLFGISSPMAANVVDAYPDGGLTRGAVYLSCGDSSATDIPSESVDAVITDPPFFDNVHYSELADFFYVWHQLWFQTSGTSANDTTRRPGEVQDKDSLRFMTKLQAVFRECHRVLKNDGLMVFSYHHSREDGWTSVAASVLGAGFRFVAAQPVKAELSVAAPKLAAKSPIDLDVMLVCRKAQSFTSGERPGGTVEDVARAKVTRFNATGRMLSENDVRVVVLSEALVHLCANLDGAAVCAAFEAQLPDLARLASKLHLNQAPPRKTWASATQPGLL